MVLGRAWVSSGSRDKLEQREKNLQLFFLSWSVYNDKRQEAEKQALL